MDEGFHPSSPVSSDYEVGDSVDTTDSEAVVDNLHGTLDIDWEHWFESRDVEGRASDFIRLADMLPMFDRMMAASEGDTSVPEFALGTEHVDLDFLHRHGTVRVDVDSIKGLLHFGNLLDVFFLQDGGNQDGTRLSGATDVQFSISCTITRDDDHLLGTGWTRNGQPWRVGHVSSPKLPCVTAAGLAETSRGVEQWPFPNLRHNGRLEWKSIVQFPHFLFGTAFGPSGVELNLWCILVGCEATNTTLVRGKKAFQSVIHKTKDVVIRAIDGIIGILGNRRAERDLRRAEVLSMDEAARLVYRATMRWLMADELPLKLFQSVKTSLVAWSFYETLPSHSKKGERHILPPAALDCICQCFGLILGAEVRNLAIEDASCLLHSLVFIDSKGMKERLNYTGKLAEVPSLVEELRRDVSAIAPGLFAATHGLCRVDVGYEWMVHGDDPRMAIMWSIQNHLPLLGAMPEKWKRSARLYSCLGMSQAVDMQAHQLHWIPPSKDFEGIVPPVATSALPNGQGPKFMDIVVPGRIIDTRMLVSEEDVAGLFDGVSVVNLYCPGPRKLTTSYGKHWGLDFQGVAQILAILAHIGDGEGLRNVLATHVEKAATVVAGFQNHVSRELPAQRTWTLRAEVGAVTLDSAVRLLDWYSAKNGLGNVGHHVSVGSSNERFLHRRPLSTTLDTVSSFLVKYVRLFWGIVVKRCTHQPVTCRDAIVAGWAEQAIRCVHFLVRGQNPWGYSVARTFLSSGFLERGILLPDMLESAATTYGDQENEEFLLRVYDPKHPVLGSALGKHRVRGLSRLLQRSITIRPILRRLVGHRSMNVEAVYLDLCRGILECFYEDAWHYLVSKGHWQGTAPVPKFLAAPNDCEFNIARRQSQLRHVGFNSKASRPSHVYSDQGIGRRGVYSREFVRRWFAVSGREVLSTLEGHKAQNMRFYSTLVLWDVVRTSVSREHVLQILDTLERVMSDARLLETTGGNRHNSSCVSAMLVPDGPGPTRPFNTLNHWVAVVGRIPPAFHPSDKQPAESCDLVEVDRKMLEMEHDLFKRATKRGFTDHELDVFSMFVLLEGGADRLNDVDHATRVKVKLNHIDAFRDPSKARLYCFRLRRSVKEITDKYNKGFMARNTSVGQWSLHEMVRRIRRCLGRNAFDVERRLNQQAAREWLVQNNDSTLREFRLGFHGGHGPVVDGSNRAAWEAHLRTPMRQPIPEELLPMGYGDFCTNHCTGTFQDGRPSPRGETYPRRSTARSPTTSRTGAADFPGAGRSEGTGAAEGVSEVMEDSALRNSWANVEVPTSQGTPLDTRVEDMSRSTFYGRFTESD